MNKNSDKQQGVTVKLFAGCQLNSELRMLLNQSKSWRQLLVLPAEKRKNIVEVHYQDKDYIGIHLIHKELTLIDLKKCELDIKEALKVHCAESSIDPLKIYIFPQLFIA